MKSESTVQTKFCICEKLQTQYQKFVEFRQGVLEIPCPLLPVFTTQLQKDAEANEVVISAAAQRYSLCFHVHNCLSADIAIHGEVTANIVHIGYLPDKKKYVQLMPS